jgi:hypothetical protein
MAGIGAWEALPSQELLVIAIPHVGIVSFDWAVSFKVLQPSVPYNIISNRGLPIDRARDDLVLQAKALGATKLFFLDSDVKVPPDGLARLWNWHLPIVCGVYGSKHESPGVWVQTAPGGDNRYSPVNPQILEQYPLFHHPQLVVGAGCMLIDLKIFDRIEKPWFEWTQGRRPGGVSEDFYFCEKVRAAGIPIHIDNTVRCDHIDWSQLNWKGERSRLQV